MIKVRTKILITILLTAVALVGVAVLCLGNGATDDGQNATEMQSDVQVVNTATPTTELEPTFMAQEVSTLGNTMIEHIIDDNHSVVYRGVGRDQWYVYAVKWNAPHSDVIVPYKLTFEDSNGDDMGFEMVFDGTELKGRSILANATPPCKAGTYTVKITITSETYYVAEINSRQTFEIDKLPIVISSDSLPDMEYSGSVYRYVPKIENTSSAPDDIESMFSFNFYRILSNGSEIGLGEDVKPIDAGTYRVEISFDNDNYINDVDRYDGRFMITPAPLDVDYVLDDDIIYDGTDRTPEAKIKSECWKYNTATDAYDSANATLIITKKGHQVEDMITVGEYQLSMTCDNSNYYIVNTKTVTILKKRLEVNWTVDNQVVYDGNVHGAEAVMTGVVSGDDVSVTVKYNGKTDLPLNAGNYLLTCIFEGADVENYDFVVDDTKAYIYIDKAVYAIDDFDVRLYDKKIIVIETDFGDIQVAFSIDGETWQQSNELEGRPMQDYEVRVKLAESANYKEKILTKTVRTGFDAEVFDQMMKDVDLEGFSFKDVVKYRELERCLTYLAEGDIEENIDVQYLNQVREAFVEYKDLAQEVTEQALSLSGAIIVKYAVGAIGTLGLLGLTIVRRKKNEI